MLYTGTHDNNTVRGWFEEEVGPEGKERIATVFGRLPSSQDIAREYDRTRPGISGTGGDHSGPGSSRSGQRGTDEPACDDGRELAVEALPGRTGRRGLGMAAGKDGPGKALIRGRFRGTEVPMHGSVSRFITGTESGIGFPIRIFDGDEPGKYD